MNNFSWMNHPAMKNIDARKLAILVELANEAEGKSQDKVLPLLMTANAKLKSMNLTFTKEENDLLVDILTKDMSPADRQKVEMIKKMAKSPRS
ncbi:hypothetical protein [Anaerocolumna xylanovorans]|uniref:Uncharacterized protein n=1 Tax=Anaerocolumna xylanovorans DSM 12503 TaxID=1121345 RepID=A0A1M7YF42_9FIRM|nr:hypothetical protein [Anaerocolumna xylanovorans]SHO51233.1 hypothetical protein SAMN02745217_03075 [Anaerocolumna xylanovorans DSM 12503]